MKASTDKRTKTFVYHGTILVLGFFMIYPVLWLIASSFKDHSEIFVNAHSLVPKRLHFGNYIEGWRGFGRISFATFFKNSFIIVILSTIGQVMSSAVVAYGFSRIKFKGRKFWFVCMIATLMLPAQVLIIPQYILFNKLGWLNSFKPLIVPSYFGMPFFIFMIMQFIQGIPTELDQSAKIDGCGKYRIFFVIILPLIIPALITSAIFSFYWKWEDFLGPLLYLQKTKLYPISLALKMFSDPAAVTNWGAMFAMSVLSLVPVFSIFVIFQKYLVEGISTSGLKG
ncbi:MAG: carbohydrate ABC transporter permease [Firmicutes bacterium]|nr:carbohydrate ABC transporter permease [Bacillota bacterium]